MTWISLTIDQAAIDSLLGGKRFGFVNVEIKPAEIESMYEDSISIKVN